MWFPGIDKAVENMVKSCHMCQSVCARPHCEPLKMSQLPNGPWQQVLCDFKGPLPNGEYLLVMIDNFSHFPIVNIVSTTSANGVIPVLDHVMSELGIVKVLQTDNGPPFQSEAFQNFAENLGFHHCHVTPLWPAANGLVENFMKRLGKVIKISNGHDKPFVQLLHTFLRDYRSTPHSTTGYLPHFLLFGCHSKTLLPEISPLCVSPAPDDVAVNDFISKARQKEYTDKQHHAVPSQAMS